MELNGFIGGASKPHGRQREWLRVRAPLQTQDPIHARMHHTPALRKPAACAAMLIITMSGPSLSRMRMLMAAFIPLWRRLQVRAGAQEANRAAEERDLSRARHIAGGYKPAIVVDDLRWLLDKEENGGSLAAGAAKEVEAELREVEEGVTKLRIAYGTLRNQSLRKTHKVEALEEELRLVLQQTGDGGRLKVRVGRAGWHAATMAWSRWSSSPKTRSSTPRPSTCSSRLREEKGGGNELLDKLRQKMSEQGAQGPAADRE